MVANNGHLLVAHLGVSHIDVAVANLAGEIRAHIHEPLEISSGPAMCLDKVDELFAVAARDADAPGVLWGIGIGVPGPVQLRTGLPVAPTMQGWDGFPIAERFERRYGAPVLVDNDVDVMALGEWRSGIAAGHENVIFVKVGTGIGAGIIADGRLYRGAQGCAGDIGHIQVSKDPSIICKCGQIGCLEVVAGGDAIARSAAAIADSATSPILAGLLEEKGSLTAEDVTFAASSGDPASAQLLQQSARIVGETVASLVNFFNPSFVVIGGEVAASGDRYLATVRETVYGRSRPLATRGLQIGLSSLGATAGVRGCTEMILDEILFTTALGNDDRVTGEGVAQLG
jgi:glucokinase-like ROK family protein